MRTPITRRTMLKGLGAARLIDVLEDARCDADAGRGHGCADEHVRDTARVRKNDAGGEPTGREGADRSEQSHARRCPVRYVAKRFRERESQRNKHGGLRDHGRLCRKDNSEWFWPLQR